MANPLDLAAPARSMNHEANGLTLLSVHAGNTSAIVEAGDFGSRVTELPAVLNSRSPQPDRAHGLILSILLPPCCLRMKLVQGTSTANFKN